MLGGAVEVTVLARRPPTPPCPCLVTRAMAIFAPVVGAFPVVAKAGTGAVGSTYGVVRVVTGSAASTGTSSCHSLGA